MGRGRERRGGEGGLENERGGGGGMGGRNVPVNVEEEI